jgi:hypothetical protein
MISPLAMNNILEAAVIGVRDVDMALSAAKIRNLSEVGDRQLN